MRFKVTLSTKGNHGHQLKDAIGGILFGRISGWELTNFQSEYLAFSGINRIGSKMRLIDRAMLLGSAYSINGPYWEGFDKWTSLQGVIGFHKGRISRRNARFVNVQDATRVHPHQAKKFFLDGRFEKDYCNELLNELQAAYNAENTCLEKPTDIVNICAHFNRGIDFDNKNTSAFIDPSAPRYFFPIEYYKTIFSKIRSTLTEKKLEFHIYTEEYNSDALDFAFLEESDVTIIKGRNRSVIQPKEVERIFNAFVKADILVSSNSSFSVTASYFRSGPTIFHPHDHLNVLNEDYIPTTITGNFDHAKLMSSLNKNE